MPASRWLSRADRPVPDPAAEQPLTAVDRLRRRRRPQPSQPPPVSPGLVRRARAAARQHHPLAVGTLAAAIALTGIAAIPTTAVAGVAALLRPGAPAHHRIVRSQTRLVLHSPTRVSGGRLRLAARLAQRLAAPAPVLPGSAAMPGALRIALAGSAHRAPIVLGLAGRELVFYARERGHRGWQGLHAAVTDRAGWAIVVIPAQSTGTQFRVRFAGDRVDEPAASGVLGARHRAASRAGLRPALESAAGGIVFPFLDAREAQSPGGWSLDQGVDINAWGDACGSAAILVAVADGTVVQEGIAGFGPTAPVIAVSRGPLAGRYVYYGHTGTVFVPVGASVRAGQPIAEIGCGSVGNSAAPHVEIGMSWPGGPTCCPGYQATSPALFRLLAAAY